MDSFKQRFDQRNQMNDEGGRLRIRSKGGKAQRKDCRSAAAIL